MKTRPGNRPWPHLGMTLAPASLALTFLTWPSSVSDPSVILVQPLARQVAPSVLVSMLASGDRP
jgi:hypothetical protein